MEAFFDNKTNILNARICAKLDGSEMYTVETKFDFHGRIQTILRDRNPVLSGSSSVGVGAINWKEKIFEVKGQKSKYHKTRLRFAPAAGHFVAIAKIPQINGIELEQLRWDTEYSRN
ncbi:hypothetical protein R3P38DRAFT_3445070 [Favolaschia claudopus]|uniref:Uncharacterized protein n=1 Tax=Favolaschia claudopus TaxID=2862362 RepID=A0AAV9ZNY5_9AGAR